MKENIKFIITSLLLIISVAISFLVRENQHLTQIENYLENEVQREETRLEVYNNFTESYNWLLKENERLNKLLKDSEVEWEEYTVTGYSANDPEQGTNNVVSTGFNLDYTRVQNLPIAASNCIPLYSVVEIKGLGGFIILDTGLGYWDGEKWEDENWIDILFPTKEEANRLGKRIMEARVIK